MNLRNCILFALALNATPDEANEVIDSIRHQFGLDGSGAVSPVEIAATQAQPVTLPVTLADIGSLQNLPAQTANATTGPVDATGIPWDSRIHASTKALSQDGTWRARRNVDAGTKAKIEAELRATMGAPVAAAVTAAPVLPTLPAAPAATMPPLPGANVETPFTKFVQFIVEQTTAGTINDAWVKQVMDNYGIADGSLQNLAHRPDLIPTIEAAVRAALGK